MRPQPNPFTNQTQFEFVVSERQHVDLSVYDVHDHLVTTLTSGMFSQGRHAAVWSGNEADGGPVAPRIYFAMIKAGSVRSTQRVILSR
jgi:flagellar hook assembly protein FlgD